jgi:hypothetical protein
VTGSRRWTVAAAVGYSAAWIAGLMIFSASTDVRSTGAQIVAGYHGHTGLGTAQFVLTEGVASLCLAVVAWAVGDRVVRATGLTAAGLAFVQCGLGIYLTVSLVPAGRADAAETVLAAINRVDGVKMFVLAAMALGGFAFGRRTGRLPAWLGPVAIALAAAIIVSGVGYALLIGPLATAAYASLPLLLLWVTGAGLLLRPAPARPARPVPAPVA